MRLGDGRIVKVTQIQDAQQADQVYGLVGDAIARCQARRIPIEDMMFFIAEQLAPYVEGMSTEDLSTHILAFPADSLRIGAAVLGGSLR